MDLGFVLKKIREVKSVPIYRVASAACMTEDLWLNVEGGQRDIGVVTLHNVCSVLNVSSELVIFLSSRSDICFSTPKELNRISGALMKSFVGLSVEFSDQRDLF